MTVTSVPLLRRIWLSWVTSFRILFDGRFAAKVALLPDGDAQPESTIATPAEPIDLPRKEAASGNAALQLLSLLQREGRLLDFLYEDLTLYPDEQGPRLPSLGLRALTRSGLRLVNDGKNREVTISN